MSGVSAKVQIAVTGTVIDENDEPMIGIGIVVKNATIGTATDLDGKFNITVPNSNSVLVFSFIGYKTREETVGSRKVLNVVLKEDHNFKIMAGYNQEYKHNKYSYAARKDLIDNNNPSINLAQEIV